MLYTARVFFDPRSNEGGVRLEGKSGKEAKNLILEKDFYKKHNAELNAALDNALFNEFADRMDGDEKFDIDNQEDLLAMKILIERIRGEVTLSPEKKKQYAEALNLISELRDLHALQLIEKESNVGQTQEKLMKLKKKAEEFSDFNEDGYSGTGYKNPRKEQKFNRKEREQREIEDIKKDFMDAVYQMKEIDDNGKEIIKWAIEKGELDPDDLEGSLAKSYVDATMPEKQGAIALARKERFKTAGGGAKLANAEAAYERAMEEGQNWARNMKNILQRHGRWDAMPDEYNHPDDISTSKNFIQDNVSLRGMAKLEKKNRKLEKKKQRQTVDNRDEVIMTENEWKNTIDATIKMMGQNEFSAALYKRLARMMRARGRNDLPKWDNAEEFLTLLEDKDTLMMVRDLLYEVLPHMTVVSLKNWLMEPMKKLPGEKEMTSQEQMDAAANIVEQKYGKEIGKKTGAAISAAEKSISPVLSATDRQEMQRKLDRYAALQIAGGALAVNKADVHTENVVDKNGNIISSTNRVTNSGINVAGLGGGVSLDLGRAGDISERMSIGLGMSTSGQPGFVIDLGMDIQMSEDVTVHADVGIANIVPFTRLSVDHVLNGQKLKTTLAPTPLWKAGMFVEASPVYFGAGFYLGSNLMAGIERQAQNMERVLKDVLKDVQPGIKADDLEQMLWDQVPSNDPANRKYIRQMALHIIDGMENFDMTTDEIAETYISNWTNHALKESKGHGDLSVEVGIGAVLSVPVIKIFIGVTIYGRSTMRTDMYDKQKKDANLNSLSSFRTFDNSDVKGMSVVDKLQYWLGEGFKVSSKEGLITIAKSKFNTDERSIYDQCDIYVKNPSSVIITADHMTFPKGMSVFAGRLIDAYKTKEKIYLGYDRKTDAGLQKREVNKPINGKPENFAESDHNPEVEVKRISLDFGPDIPLADKLLINDMLRSKSAQEKFVNATKPGKENEENKKAYNERFEKFATLTQKTASPETYEEIRLKMSTIITRYVKLFANDEEWRAFEDLWDKSDEHKRQIVNVFLQAGSFSARVDAIRKGKGYAGSESVGKLLKNRKGHIEAFKASGVVMDAHAFDDIYSDAKNTDGKKEKYGDMQVGNAVALVGYYRKGMKPTTGLVGFGEVDIATGDGKEFKRDAAHEKKVYDRFIDILQGTSEFKAQHEKINAALKKNGLNVQLDDAQMKELIKNKVIEINGVKIELPSVFEKVLNGPCANEAYMLRFGDLIVSYKKENVYVGVEYTNNYLTVNTFKVGLGIMAGGQTTRSSSTRGGSSGSSSSGQGSTGTPGSHPVDDVGGTPGSNPVDGTGTGSNNPGNNGNQDPGGNGSSTGTGNNGNQDP